MFQPWLEDISVSEARRRFSELLRRIEADPTRGYRILRRDEPVAELRRPRDGRGRLRSATDARRQFSSLLLRIDRNPDAGYRIRVYNRVAAELCGPQPEINSGAALLRLADWAKRHPVRRHKGPPVTSENYKEFLYGHWPPRRSRRRS